MSSRRKPRYTLHSGFRMPMGFPVEGFQSALHYRAEPGDVFISTYPKCGTTWMQNIVWLILQRGKALAAAERMSEIIPHLEEVGCVRVEQLPEPRVVKTHLPFAMSPQHPEARYLYVARNPLDCVVSFYHHTKGFVQHYDFAEGSFDDYFECFILGEVDFGDYFENVLSWFRHRGDSNLLFITYEEMKADLERVVIQVATFLGPEHAATVADPSLLRRILEFAGFESMARDQARWASSRADGMAPFVRKGVVGDWVEHFSPFQVRRMLDRIESQPGALELVELWPDVMAEARSVAVG